VDVRPGQRDDHERPISELAQDPVDELDRRQIAQ